MYDKLTMDGVQYDVRIMYGSIQRTFEIVEGTNADVSINATRIRDILGTAYSYQMQIEPNPNNMADYYSFYEAISSPQNFHHITAPYNNTTIDFDCCIDGGTDADMGIFANNRKWSALTLAFTPKAPQRRTV